MRTRKAAVALALAGVGVLGLATSASALDCHNVSGDVSATEYNIATTTNPLLSIDLGAQGSAGEIVWNVILYLKGNWYLVELTENSDVVHYPNGVVQDPGTVLQVDAVWWGFIPPGTFSAPFVPGSNGNYTNSQVDDLLGLAACPTARHLYNRIQSGACGGIASAF